MSQFCQILEECDGLKCGVIYQVNQIFTKNNGHLYKGRRICELSNNDDNCDRKMNIIKAKFGGVVAKLLIKPGDVVSVGQPVLEMEACTHPTTLGNICCDCGVILEDNDNEREESKTNGLVSMLHSIPDLKVSKEEAKRLGTDDINNLLENHKLVLLVDLDQTLIHTTNDNIPPKLKDVFHFQLAPCGPWYHTRLRPFASKFLQNMSKYYQLHICTFGVREYAHSIAHFLDKDHKLFGDRILSRNECLDPLSKKANLSSLFPCGDNLVCIIDDRSDVWNFAPNVVQVMPYHFFQHTGDINAPPGLQKKENDDDSKGFDFTKMSLEKDDKSHDSVGKDDKSGDSVEKDDKSENLVAKDDKSENSLEKNYQSKDSLAKYDKAEILVAKDDKSGDSVEKDDKSENLVAKDDKSENSLEKNDQSEDSLAKDDKAEILVAKDDKSEDLMDTDIKFEDLVDTDNKSKNLVDKDDNLEGSEMKVEIMELKSDETNEEERGKNSDDSSDLKRKRKSDQMDDNKNKRSRTKLSTDDETEQLSDSPILEECSKLMSLCSDPELGDAVKVYQSSSLQNSAGSLKPPLTSDTLKPKLNTVSLSSTDNSVVEETKSCNKKLDVVKELSVSIDIAKSEETPSSIQSLNRSSFESSTNLVISCDNSSLENISDPPESSELKLDKGCPKLNENSKDKASNTNGNSSELDSNSCRKDKESEKKLTINQKENDSDDIVVEDSDDYLLYLEDILIKLHKSFYSIYNQDKAKLPDLKQLVPESRKKVLRGSNIVFSGVIPRKTDLQESKAFFIATSLGATVTENIIAKTNEKESDNKNYTTHIIAANLHTEKVHIGKKYRHIKIVTPNWLWCCAERWEKVDERLFLLDKDSEKTVCRSPPIHCCVISSRSEPVMSQSSIINIPEPGPSTPTEADYQKLIDSVNPLAYLSDDDAKSMEQEVDGELDDEDDNDVKEDENKKNSDTESEESDVEGSSKNNSEMDECDNDGLSKRRQSRTGADDDDDDEDEDVDDEEDELPSVRFRQGGTLSSEDSDNDDDDDMNAYGDILAKELMD